MKIETTNLLIREIRTEDFNSLYSLLSDEEVMRYSVYGPYSLEQTKEWISFITDHYTKKPFGMWAVIEKKTDILIGISGLMPLEDDETEYQVGYRILPKFQGRGYGTEAVLAIRDYAIKKDLKKFIAFIVEENKPSIRVAEKAGMKFLRHDTYKDIPILLYEYKLI
ncbi:MAG: GNAT family N-acetyltransferase [Gammaproteobacteria bacterium]